MDGNNAWDSLLGLMVPERLMLVILIGLVLWASITDFRQRRIPNIVCALTAITGIIWQIQYGGDLVMALIIASVVLCIGFLVHLKEIFGAGDVKLLVALTIFAGPEHSLLFLLQTFAFGGAVSLIWIKFQPYRLSLSMVGLLQSAKLPKDIPFALPIAAGTVLMALRMWPGA